MQIKTIDLTHIFDKKMVTEFKALDKVSTTLNKGEFITIIGQTGSGKTTFIEHLNALILPTEGEVIIDGRVIKNTRRKIKKIKEQRKKVGIVFQFAEYQLFEETILKDIIFGPVSMGIPKEEAIEQAKKYINLVGLDESYLERSPFSLSGGQKRRVALAGILAMEPDIMIFDEPTAGLDPHGEKEIYKIFNKIHDQGKGVVIVTHNLDHVLNYSTRTLVFKEGKLIRDGLSVDIMYDYEFLLNNELEPPKLVSLVHDVRKRGLDIPNVRTITEFASAIKGK